MESLPECALTCLIGAISNSTCDLTDFACICADAQLNVALGPCIAGSCTIKESLTAQNFSYSTCQYPASDNTLTFPIVNIVGIVVAIVSVVLRVTNRIVAGQLGLDDYTIVAALLVAVAISGVGFPLKTHGLGKNIWTVPFDDISETMKLFFIEENLYVFCTALVKLSMLFLYLRLFPNRPLRLAIFASLWITAAWGLGSFFAQIFSCKPISFYWNQWDGEHEGKCSSHNNLLLGHAIINIVLDVLVIALPMPVLLRLQMSLEKRIGMCIMFAVGLVVTVISILRLVEAVGFNTTMNPTKDFVPVGVWSLLEIDIGIMCSCMPGIRAVFKRLYTTLFRKQSTYGYNSSARRKPSNSNKSGNSGSGSGSASHHREISSPRQYTPKSKFAESIRLTEVDTNTNIIDAETETEWDDTWPLRNRPPVPEGLIW
ncbi:CFEM domain-containing protein [Aspergillus undulatus]|uniref:CFEM domain-containing protein n=1 Tax=Aspergillus undulatus TaxID=1810928 RepID=UPI003CCD18B4